MKWLFKLSSLIFLFIIIQACKKTSTAVDLASALKNTTWVGEFGLGFDKTSLKEDSFYIQDSNKVIIAFEQFGKYQGKWRINGSTFVIDSATDITIPTVKIKCIGSIAGNRLEGIWLIASSSNHYDGTFYANKQ